MTEFLKILSLLVFSALKFVLAPTSAIISGYSFIEAFAITSFGGVIGFLLFLKFGTLIQYYFLKIFKRKDRRTFSKKTRMIVNFKNKYGFWGLAIFTPILFGIPLGAILASAFFGNQKKVYLSFIPLIVFWSLVLSYYSAYFKNL